MGTFLPYFYVREGLLNQELTTHTLKLTKQECLFHIRLMEHGM